MKVATKAQAKELVKPVPGVLAAATNAVEYDPRKPVYALKFGYVSEDGKVYAPIVNNFDYTPLLNGRWHEDKSSRFAPHADQVPYGLRAMLRRLGLFDDWPIACSRGWHVWTFSAWAQCFDFHGSAPIKPAYVEEDSYGTGKHKMIQRAFWLVELKGNAVFSGQKAAFTHIRFVDELDLFRQDLVQLSSLNPASWAEMLELPKGSRMLWRCNDTYYDIRQV